MFHEALGIIVVLLAIEGGLLLLADHPRTQKFFKFIPSMFWIYFLPMVANNVGLIPASSPVYGAISQYGLPACLVLLLISVDLRAIARLGRVALTLVLAGSAGIMIGGPVALLVFGHWLPEGSWSGFGALSGSWIGGSANMLAVREGLGTPKEIYTPMVVVDTICPYVWMGLLVFFSSFQKPFDRWNGSNLSIVHELTQRSLEKEQKRQHLTMTGAALMLLLAAAGTYVSQTLGGTLPEVKNMVSARAWAIILASVLGLALSLTPVRHLEQYGASRLGYAVLYFVLASIGAQTNLADLGAVPVLLAAGFLWILIHAACLLLAGRLLKAPLSLIASASQANIGGPASAPAVAGIYQNGLAPVGLLMAILGNILGTYLGIVCGHLCHWVSRW